MERNTNVDFSKMKEIEIIRIIKNPSSNRKIVDRAQEYLLKKYEKMIHRHWWTLQRQLGGSSIVNNLKEEYYSEAYEAFLDVIRKIDLSRTYDENFKIMQLLSWYLSNVRAHIIREALKKGKERGMNETSSYKDEESMTIDREIEEVYWLNEGYRTEPSYRAEISEKEEFCNQTIKECFGKWGDLERKVFILLKNRKGKGEIAEALNVKPSKVYNIADRLKKDLKTALGVSV